MPPPPGQLLRRLVVGDDAAIAAIVEASRTSDDPLILVAAALFAPDGDGLLARAGRIAATTRDRQLVAIAERAPARRARARRRPRPRPPRRPPGQRPRRLDRRRQPPPDRQGGVMNPRTHRIPADPRGRPGQRGLHRARLDLQLPRRARRAGGRGARLLPRARGRRQRMVLGPRAVRRAARPDRDRRRAPVVGARDAHRGAASGSRRPPCRSSACCAGRSSCPATRRRDGDRRRAPATRSHGERHPRHRHRRDARLSPHRHVDGARHRRARPPLRRPLVRVLGACRRRSSSSASSRRSGCR